MPKPHRFPDRQQAIHIRGRGALDLESLGCTPEEQRVADWLGGGDQQQESGMIRNRFEPALEALLEPRRQRLRRGVQQAEATGELRYRQSPRQLQQRERVATRLRNDAIADAVVEPKRDGRTQKRARVFVGEPEDLQVGEPPQIRRRDAGGEQEPDRLCVKPPCHKRERPCRHLVQPLRVVDDTEQRTLLRGLREQGQERQPDEKPIRHWSVAQAERDLEGVTLWRRESLHGLEQRCAQLVQGRERELHLGFDARSAKRPHLRCRFHGVVQKRRLPDPGLAVKDERATLAGADRGDHVVQQGALRSAPAQARPGDQVAIGHCASILIQPGSRPGTSTGTKGRPRQQTRFNH